MTLGPNHKHMLQPPSFQPWLSRVRVIRAFGTVAGFVLVMGVARMESMAWEEAVFRGFAASIICFFLTWAAALWVCSELYQAELADIRKDAAERERERQVRVEELARQRMQMQDPTASADFGPGTLGQTLKQQGGGPATTGMSPPPRREAA